MKKGNLYQIICNDLYEKEYISSFPSTSHNTSTYNTFPQTGVTTLPKKLAPNDTSKK